MQMRCHTAYVQSLPFSFFSFPWLYAVIQRTQIVDSIIRRINKPMKKRRQLRGGTTHSSFVRGAFFTNIKSARGIAIAPLLDTYRDTRIAVIARTKWRSRTNYPLSNIHNAALSTPGRPRCRWCAAARWGSTATMLGAMDGGYLLIYASTCVCVR